MDPHSFNLLDPDPHVEKLLDPDPQKNECGYTALLLLYKSGSASLAIGPMEE